jgi:hypothetical protein
MPGSEVDWCHRRLTMGALVAIALAALVVWAPPAAACSCAGFTDAEAFAEHPVVFVGELTEVQTPPGVSYSSADPERFIFEVTTVYKGEARATQSVVTPREGASCGLELTGRGPFLVYASTDPQFDLDAQDGELFSHLCTGSRALDAGPVPTSFGAGHSPEAGTSPIGQPPDDDGLPMAAIVVAGGLSVMIAASAVVLWRRRRVPR